MKAYIMTLLRKKVVGDMVLIWKRILVVLLKEALAKRSYCLFPDKFASTPTRIAHTV
jgi:hypothetical protein